MLKHGIKHIKKRYIKAKFRRFKSIMQIKLELPIKITYEENLIIAICPVFNVGSQGETKTQALKNAKEALELYLEDEDVQRQNLEKIFRYAISITLTDLEKEFKDELDIHSKSHVELDVAFHAFPETTNPISI